MAHPRKTVQLVCVLTVFAVNGQLLAREAAAVDEVASLVDQYRSLGLPLAPPGSRPVLLSLGISTVGKAGNRIEFVNLGLESPVRQPDGQVLIGTAWTRPKELPKPIEPDPALVPWGRLRLCYQDSYARPYFETNAGLATAVQLESIGMHALAHRVLTAALAESCGHHFSGFFQRSNLSAKEALAHLAWVYWGNELTRPKSDRAAIASRMKALITEHHGLDTPGNRNLLERLALAIAKASPSGSPVENLVDGLVETANPEPSDKPEDRDQLPSEMAKVLGLGFEAVPVLIQHIEDQRLTRFVMVGFNNFPTWIVSVQHLASDLLRDLAGEGLGGDPVRRLQGWPVTRAAAEEWWTRARAAGEETWLRTHALPQEPEGQWPNQAILDLLVAKYPRHLPEVYRTILEQRTNVQSWPVVARIMRSDLDRSTKTNLLVAGATHKDLEHRRAALWKLKDIDPKTFKKILLDTLAVLPRTPGKPYWHCREAAFAPLVIETDDDQLWGGLLETARRVDVGMRLELLNPMGHADRPNRLRRIRFLAEFLNDETTRDRSSNPRLFNGPFAGFDFPSISARDFAALRLAEALGLPGGRPDKSWTTLQWAAFRTQVSRATMKVQ